MFWLQRRTQSLLRTFSLWATPSTKRAVLNGLFPEFCEPNHQTRKGWGSYSLYPHGKWIRPGTQLGQCVMQSCKGLWPFTCRVQADQVITVRTECGTQLWVRQRRWMWGKVPRRKGELKKESWLVTGTDTQWTKRCCLLYHSTKSRQEKKTGVTEKGWDSIFFLCVK